MPGVSRSLTNETALDEVAWVAERALRILGGDLTVVEQVEYWERKAALLSYLGQEDLAATARRRAVLIGGAS